MMVSSGNAYTPAPRVIWIVVLLTGCLTPGCDRERIEQALMGGGQGNAGGT